MKHRLSTKEEYQKQVNIIVEYINAHLEEELDLNILAEKANFSPFHFSRIMKAFLGESVGAFIVRKRIETAARMIRYADMSIEEIAYATGYNVPSSLSKAFKLFYGISPTEYKNNKGHTIMEIERKNVTVDLKSPKIKEIESQEVIYLQAVGNYSNLDYEGAFTRLWQFIKDNKLFTAGIKHIGVFHDDPKVTADDKLRTDICLVIHKEVKPQADIGVKTIEGGKFAVFLHVGPYNNVGAMYDAIYSKWLPESGHKLRNAPSFEMYLNDPSRVEEPKLKTDLYIPIE